MKSWSAISFWLFCSTVVAGQDFRGENRVFIKFETISDGFLEYESDKFTIELNKEQNQLTFFVDLQTFKPVDNSASTVLFDDIFQEEFYSDITYKSDLPALKIDAQTDRAQQVDLNGTLVVGAVKTELPFSIEIKQMDRFLFLNFDLATQLSKMGIEIPDAYKNTISGKIHLEVLNGKLTEGFR